MIINRLPFPAVSYDPILANNSPGQIQSAVRMGIADKLWGVGDRTAAISIGSFGNMGYTSAYAFIIGFNHNSSIEGTGIHFQFGKTITGTDIAFVDSGYGNWKTSGTWFNMNNSEYNGGGWASSRMRNTICSTFLTELPQEWQNIIAETTKYSDNTERNATRVVSATTDKIFLLAEWEVFGARTYANSDEQNYQQQYAYYANGNSKAKYKHNDTTTECEWWLRSSSSAYGRDFCSVDGIGRASSSFCECPYGFAPGFKVA